VTSSSRCVSAHSPSRADRAGEAEAEEAVKSDRRSSHQAMPVTSVPGCRCQHQLGYDGDGADDEVDKH
jgi:hypothetical protein